MADLVARASGAVGLKARAGDILFRVGHDCHGLIALRSGALRIGLTSAARRELVLFRARPGKICLQTFSCLARQGA